MGSSNAAEIYGVQAEGELCLLQNFFQPRTCTAVCSRANPKRCVMPFSCLEQQAEQSTAQKPPPDICPLDLDRPIWCHAPRIPESTRPRPPSPGLRLVSHYFGFGSTRRNFPKRLCMFCVFSSPSTINSEPCPPYPP